MAAKDKNTRLKSNMTIAILLGVGRFGARRRLVFSALEGDVDIYTIIFAVLAVFIFLRLRSVLGQRTGSGFAYRLSMIAAGLCAVHYVAYEAKWYSALIALWRRMNINWHDPDLYSSLCRYRLHTIMMHRQFCHRLGPCVARAIIFPTRTRSPASSLAPTERHCKRDQCERGHCYHGFSECRFVEWVPSRGPGT